MSLEEIENCIKLIFPNKYAFENGGRYLNLYHIIDDEWRCDVGFIEVSPVKILHISRHSQFANDFYEDMKKIFNLDYIKRYLDRDYTSYILEEKSLE